MLRVFELLTCLTIVIRVFWFRLSIYTIVT